MHRDTMSCTAFCSPGCTVNWSWTRTAMLTCLTPRSSECWTSTHHCVQDSSSSLWPARQPTPVRRSAASLASNSVGALNVGISEPVCSPTSRLICRLVQRHVSHAPMRSSLNLMRRPMMCVPPGERHRDCCTAGRRSHTLSARS